MIYKHISQLIGNTPILEVPKEVTDLKNINLYAKLEYMNPFGSLKDRIAKNMLEPIKSEMKDSNKTVLEASSGNTGKALAILSSVDGIKFKAVSNRMKIPEMRMIMQLSGAEIEELPGISDCPDLNDPNSYTTAASNMAKNEPDKYRYTDQYFNERNWQAHLESGKEITEELSKVDFLFTMLGTTGSSVGIGRALKEVNPELNVYGVVASAGQHIPGARNSNELWEVGFYNPEFYKDILSETTDGAISGAVSLIQKVGILSGPTAGATFNAALKKLKELDKELEGKNETYHAVFIVCDRVEPYLNFFKSHKPELFSKSTSSKPKVSDVVVTDTEKIKISIDDLKNRQNEFMVIDIRGNFPYSIGHIESSINIVDESLANMIEEGKVFPMDKKIVVVCRIGDISGRYAQFLRNQGYEAYSLDGGIQNWKDKNLELGKTI
ncbi:MAG: pyridoxal-phosphate dependent enzyme [Candidatus Dojkabacteria bacterium]